MVEIFKLDTINGPDEFASIVEQVKTIFYVSSSLKEFSSEEKRTAFFRRWCGDYIKLYPDQFLLMMEDDKLLGYLSGCLNSSSAAPMLEVPGFNIFSDLFEQFPAHFHINFSPACRGRGLGTSLVEHFCDDLKLQGIQGCHLVTSTGAANISFYHRAGFNYEVQREFHQSKLLFMGRILEHC
ncbi:MAG: GNAT family N-acetyltransferase [Bacteriovorax sp.]|jgi:ribosomal protein S18 acetylase RimI-like enzyme